MQGAFAKPKSKTAVNNAGNADLSFVVCAVAFAALLALSVGLSAGEVSFWGADASGVLFLIMAASYRGSARLWWFFWAPFGLLLLFGPIARWESSDLATMGGLVRAALVPGLGFIGGTLLATVRDTLQTSNENSTELGRLQKRMLASLIEVQRLERDMIQVQDVIDSLSSMPSSVMKSRDGESQPSHVLDSVVPDFSASESEVMSHVEIHRLIADEVDRIGSPTVQFSATADRPVPLAVRGKAVLLSAIVRDLLGVSFDSLGAVSGVVRVALRPGPRSVSVMIEDNGRGLGEEMIGRLEARGLFVRTSRLNLREIRALIEAVGWKLIFQARLGVGSRMTLELPRVDAFAPSSSRSSIRFSIQDEAVTSVQKLD